MTIYRLYAQNENRAGFWIQHRSWQGRCAQVQSIAARSRGSLPGFAPTHADAPIVISCFDVRSGRCLEPSHVVEFRDDRGYVRIAKPPWSTLPFEHDMVASA